MSGISGKRGFGSMDPQRQREIASLGGRAAHRKGTAHEWDHESATAAGRKGGSASQVKRRAAAQPTQQQQPPVDDQR